MEGEENPTICIFQIIKFIRMGPGRAYLIKLIDFKEEKQREKFCVNWHNGDDDDDDVGRKSRFLS